MKYMHELVGIFSAVVPLTLSLTAVGPFGHTPLEM
jgi:hypothetical protein